LQRPDSERSTPHIQAQAAAAWTAADASARENALDDALTRQDQALRDAMREMQAVENFVGSPEHILGSDSTKHGEIAEQIHVGVRRAFDVLHQRMPTATFEGVGRLAPVDYVDGGDIQSKYYSALLSTLDGIASHAEQYSDFAASGGRYHIPQDQFEQLMQFRHGGTIVGLSDGEVERIRERIESLLRETGRPLNDLIAPGEAKYDEVQLGRVPETIQDNKNELAERNQALQAVEREAHGPSLDGAVAGAGSGAAAGAGVRFGHAVWNKMRAGKNPFRGEFCVEDWQDVGVDMATGARGGAVAGVAVYGLTNATDLAAPFAGSLVSGLMGIGNLLGQHRAGTIDDSQFVDLALAVASDSAIVGLSAAAGQTLIPIPLLGAFLGSIAGKVVATGLRDVFANAETPLLKRVEAWEARADASVSKDEALRVALDKIDAKFGRLTDLTRVAFDERTNVKMRFAASIRNAKAVGVPGERIHRSTSDTHTFMCE
jgi:hypothetical protein